MSILDELWYGNIAPYERDFKRGSTYSELLGYIVRHKEDQLKRLNDAEKRSSKNSPHASTRAIRISSNTNLKSAGNRIPTTTISPPRSMTDLSRNTSAMEKTALAKVNPSNTNSKQGLNTPFSPYFLRLIYHSISVIPYLQLAILVRTS